MEKQPTQKVNYVLPSTQLKAIKGGVKNLELLYNKYLQYHNCTGMFPLINRYASVDAILNSGQTACSIEYKARYFDVYKYTTSMLEHDKFIKIKEVQALLACKSFYIVEYNQCILIYDLTSTDVRDLTWQTIPCPSTIHKNQYVDKKNALLNYSDASIIISKKDWKRKSFDELNKYMAVMIEYNYQQALIEYEKIK